MPADKKTTDDKLQQASEPSDIKTEQLKAHTEDGTDQPMTTDQGVRINDDQNSLKAGSRGATLLEDFILREKITHFDHERIPERVVHARGAAAHGVFRVYESMAHLTKAGFLQDPTVETPVFVRFSTVAGSRGSTDLARDVRGFAVKFYTNEGNFDLVGNNMPVFFIQDAMKFPDLIHAVKPEPDNEIPQAASAHDTFWDFISLMPESAHMIMWAMSDRAIPRSYRMMEGFGVHTFRLINEEGVASFVKFHWKPLLGVHSVAWEEAQLISGKDPDFHRRDLWDAIESGAYPEWELGIQVVPEADEHKYEFDLLDPTKLIPEELVPVQRIGKLILNRNPDNFFAETEQVAFHVGNIVPGIDFTNDPLMQGRLFSYTDTQLIRLGGPNFHEIPINRPIVPVHNNQRDGFMRQTINKGKSSYHPNSTGGGCPYQSGMLQGGFTSYEERIDGRKIRERSKSFFDHFSQATLFYRSQSQPEQQHIINALSFELGKVKLVEVRKRMLVILSKIDKGLARQVADALGLEIPSAEIQLNYSIPADGDIQAHQPVEVRSSVDVSRALSMADTVKDTIATRKVAFLAADGVRAAEVNALKLALESQGATVELIAPRLGKITADDQSELAVDNSLLTAASVLYDAVFVPGGASSLDVLAARQEAIRFINEAFRHCKAIAGSEDAAALFSTSDIGRAKPGDPDGNHLNREGIIVSGDITELGNRFVNAIAQHRFWEREQAL